MHDTIFAPVTLTGASAISVFRVSGNNSSKILKLLIKERKLPPARRLLLKKVFAPQDYNNILDICLICWMPKPNSFTGDDCFEIHCHGGLSTSQAFINAFSKIKGLRFAEAGEFSKRAIINGKLDLVRAEAVNEVILAETEQQRNLSLKQLEKGLSIPIKLWRTQIIEILSSVEATIDFSDEEAVPKKINFKKKLLNLSDQIKNVLKEGKRYNVITSGLKVVLTGATNVGKSSLFNYIVKKEKSIVTNVPGTTRDIIERKINYKGFPIIFYDTAGIRKAKSPIEKEGIKRALKIIEKADIVLDIHDIQKLEIKSLKKDPNYWKVYNKLDKLGVKRIKVTLDKDKNTFLVSAKTGEGINLLMKKIYSFIQIKIKKGQESNYFYSNARQKNDLEKALNNVTFAVSEKEEEIIAEYLRLAISDLERILGKVDVEEVLGNIFSRFCIGK